MGSAHSKPKKSLAARKHEISYPRTQPNSKPLHAYGHYNPKPQPTPQQLPKHPYYHGKHNIHHPAEPRYYGTMKTPRSSAHHSKHSVSHPDEPRYYGTMKPPQVAAARTPIKRKPVAAPSDRAQIQHYSNRSLPPVPGDRAAAKSMRVQYGHC